MVFKQKKVCGKKLLTLTKVQLPSIFYSMMLFLVLNDLLKCCYCFTLFKGILSMTMYVPNLDFFIL